MDVVIMKTAQRIPGVDHVDYHRFSTGHMVPVFDVLDAHAFTQVVGYAKYTNRECGSVYYRGQCKLYPSVQPSICRAGGNAALGTKSQNLNRLINEVTDGEKHTQLMHELKLEGRRRQRKRLFEAALQHYGIPTRCIDAVDNHWVALWFGLYECETRQVNHETYALYRQREASFLDSLGKESQSYYQYILLLCARNEGDQHVVDLRVELPSTFLRPHAQHGVILQNDDREASYDLADFVVGILRIRIDRALRWLGQGQLTSYASLFPSPMHDHGYGVLLQNQELFRKYGSMITNYAYDVQ